LCVCASHSVEEELAAVARELGVSSVDCVRADLGSLVLEVESSS